MKKNLCKKSNFVSVSVISFALLLGGCATQLNGDAAKVKVVDQHFINSSHCEFVGSFYGASGISATTNIAINNSRNETIEQAAEGGANYIVWSSTVGGLAPSATGNGYICQK